MDFNSFQTKASVRERSLYRGKLDRIDRVTSFQFTLRFRNGSGSWQWIRDKCGVTNGEVVFRPSTNKGPSTDIACYLGDINTGFEIHRNEDPQRSCCCWDVGRSVPAAHGSQSGWDRATLATPLAALRWFALVRHNEPWFSPRQGPGPLKLDKDALLLSFLRTDGQHIVLVAVSGFDNITCVFKTDEEGRVVVFSRNDGEEAGTARIFVAVGPDWPSAVETALTATKAFAHGQIAKAEYGTEPSLRLRSEEEKNLANWYDGFTYCTWNGLGQDLTTAKIFESLDTLKKNEIDISNLIIDDNWQSLEFSGVGNFYQRWTDFEANSENFPRGLKNTISEIRKFYPGIVDIAVWHGIFGYWGGISPGGTLAREYTMRTFKKQEGLFLGGGIMTTVDGADVGRLYDDFYRYNFLCIVTEVHWMNHLF